MGQDEGGYLPLNRLHGVFPGSIVLTTLWVMRVKADDQHGNIVRREVVERMLFQDLARLLGILGIPNELYSSLVVRNIP